MVECQTCKKVLKSDAALIQHCRDKGHRYVSPSAPGVTPPPRTPAPVPVPSASAVPPAPVKYECKPCCLTFSDKPALELHVLTKHPLKPFKCAPCALDFSSEEALSIHFKHFPIHPKCPQCSAAFVDQNNLNLHQSRHPKCAQCDVVLLNRALLDEHVQRAHPPTFMCNTCGGREYDLIDRQKHYKESPNHPSCFVCGEGFADDAKHDQHLSSAHRESRCDLCSRQLRSRDALLNHYLVSPAHPHCAICEIGFADDTTCAEHMEVNHPRPPLRVPSPSPTLSVMHQSELVQTSMLETQGLSRSTQSSPLTDRPSMSTGIIPATVLAVVNDDCEAFADDDTYQTVEASSHVQRAVSEPTVTTVSSIGYGAFPDEAATAWRSPTLSERSLDYANLQGFARRAASDSTMSLQSAPSSVAVSSSRNGSVVTRPRAPASLNPGMAESIAERAASFISQSMSPRPRSPIDSTRSFSSISERLSHVTPSARPSLSRQPTPRIPSPILSPTRPHSHQSMAGSMRSSRSSSFVKAPELPTPPSSDGEQTIPARGSDTHKATVVTVTLTPPKIGSVSWHCRICLEDPCVAPTATMCGHVFCTTCIVQELVKSGSCPVCKKMILLRLNVESE